ncbi:hypothetical protein D3C79_1004850 [compost metagenome]
MLIALDIYIAVSVNIWGLDGLRSRLIPRLNAGASYQCSTVMVSCRQVYVAFMRGSLMIRHWLRR